MSGAHTPLKNPRLEKVAQELAQLKSAAEASKAAGYPDGSSFDSNARKRAQRPEVRARVAFLQGQAAELVIRDVAWIENKLCDVIETELDSDTLDWAGWFKAADMALKIKGGYAPEKTDMRSAVMNMNADGSPRSDADRSKALSAFMAKIRAKREIA